MRRRAHHDALLRMMSRFALLLSVRKLSESTHALQAALGWGSVRMRHANRHGTKPAALESELQILEAMGAELRRHNAWDIRAYEYVVARHERAGGGGPIAAPP